MLIYNILARLLDYPDQELMDNLPAVIEAIKEDKAISSQEREDLLNLISWINMHDLTGLQSQYVQTFDMVPEHDLHLTHHLFGDDRGRGPALIDLSEYYKASGLEVEGKEIPDFLPLILEYVSTLDDLQARVFLGDAAKVLKVISENLEKAESPYARILRIVENRGHLAQAA
ncbi:nitrate reductase molybdenum cofactor assembly chaperone [Sedimenticola selenatireducens]|jgi:nitrate reductase delta subunit|uniref:Nitrate reductase molybdenum cofactor assembly chaperone n=1 Tax=Sedimenticola selenatireducens TaxID=191960 RepID=A0A557SK37_9GAMM|nr:nitrate reductase molybdenum cofactor assembly chaperone [Sedimenticola selenatireducens]TVO77733.1 nitrate reductase molybdenum cofactor assembly chaperone [Sedimenticola selenatireducens]TVT65237.1 MAG: nitrate reductase molybdenum cofactor assembly chaperone [Sedimenticola selenatireducens]